MKLVRFSTNGQLPRLGALQGDRIIDLTASVAATLTARGVVRAREIAAALVPASAREFLEGGAASAEAVAAIKEPVSVPATSARLHAPIDDPGKFICIGLNYRDHAEETGNPIPKEPPIFGKWSPSIIGPGDPILRPRGSKQLDWEVELGVVIGRTARFVSRESALDYVWGYTIINDASARDFQFLTSQWMAGKIFETAAPVGPYIADRTEVPDPHSLGLRTIVNGKQMQNGNTKTFIFDVRYIVSYLSGLMTLSPGDLIATGTPPGVGLAIKPTPVFLQPGDVCRVEIDRLGSMANPIKEA
jgi:acylpyruvate hydrolase